MQGLRALYESTFPNGVKPEPLPNDAVCQACSRIVGDHPAVLARFEGKPAPIVVCRCDVPVDVMIASAGLPIVVDRAPDDPATFSNFTLNKTNKGAYDAAFAWASGEASYKALTLSGGTGSGKSHLMEAAARWIVAANVDRRREHVAAARERRTPKLPAPERIVCVRTGPLLDELRATYADHSGEDLAQALWRYLSPDVLCLDDLGSERGTDFAREQLLHIVHERLAAGRRTCITTNYDALGLAEKYDARLASRLFDRRGEAVRAVVVADVDHRTRG